MIARTAVVLLLLPAIPGLGGCSIAQSLQGRAVETHVERTLYTEVVDCMLVLPTSGDLAEAGFGETVARHLSGRVDRVIGPMERRQLERRHGFDLSDQLDEAAVARETACAHVVDARMLETDSVYAVVWTGAVVGVELVLRRAGTDRILWQGRHMARRSDGGLPLSPLSALWNAAEAGLMANDSDLHPSLMDDALRRIVATLPDFRVSDSAKDSTGALARRYGFN